MPNKDPILVGFNHMFLYPQSMVDGQTHTQTLQRLAEMPQVEALDCWVWADNAKAELATLRSCKKQINYNIGDRHGQKPMFPASADKTERAYALDTLRRETNFALEAGAKKIVFASGQDVPSDRVEAKKRFADFVAQWAEEIPKEVWLTLEPTDREIDKRFLYGDLAETCAAVESLRQAGVENLGILLDMGHIPIMRETLQSAATLGGALLEHVHLGNCVIRNPKDPFYGDKHPCWGYLGGAYTETDGAEFLKRLKQAGYFTRGNLRTVSFEMRPLTGKTAAETVEYLYAWIQNVYKTI